jgi:hypothetical protein
LRHFILRLSILEPKRQRFILFICIWRKEVVGRHCGWRSPRRLHDPLHDVSMPFAAFLQYGGKTNVHKIVTPSIKPKTLRRNGCS